MTTKAYTLKISLPAEILHGYDPKAFDKMGFTYCIHRPKKESEHFAVSSKYIQVAQHPSLWGNHQISQVIMQFTDLA